MSKMVKNLLLNFLDPAHKKIKEYISILESSEKDVVPGFSAQILNIGDLSSYIQTSMKTVDSVLRASKNLNKKTLDEVYELKDKEPMSNMSFSGAIRDRDPYGLEPITITEKSMALKHLKTKEKAIKLCIEVIKVSDKKVDQIANAVTTLNEKTAEKSGLRAIDIRLFINITVESSKRVSSTLSRAIGAYLKAANNITSKF